MAELPRLEDLSFEQLVDLASKEDLKLIEKGSPTRQRVWRHMELAVRWRALKDRAEALNEDNR